MYFFFILAIFFHVSKAKRFQEVKIIIYHIKRIKLLFEECLKMTWKGINVYTEAYLHERELFHFFPPPIEVHLMKMQNLDFTSRERSTLIQEGYAIA